MQPLQGFNLHGIAARGNVTPAASPIGMEEFSTRFIEAFVSMRAKIIALGLQQVGRQTFAAVGVEKRQRGAEGRDRNALLGGGRDRIAPPSVGLLDGLLEER